MIFRPTPQERIDDAVTRVAKARADCEHARVLEEFYAGRVAAIDPHVDWWGFAHNKEKDYQAGVDHARACAIAYALQLKLEALA